MNIVALTAKQAMKKELLIKNLVKQSYLSVRLATNYVESYFDKTVEIEKMLRSREINNFNKRSITQYALQGIAPDNEFFLQYATDLENSLKHPYPKITEP